MKIIATSNHDSETQSDVLVCENVNRFYGEKIVKYLNSEGGDHSRDFYKLVEDNHVLYKWEP